MKPKSDNLFHFTRSLDRLKSILKDGFHPRFCLEDLRWIAKKEPNFVAYPMVCFCDIPISRISDHTAFYGEYGLGMTKQWALSNKLAPVIYAPKNSFVTDVAKHLFLSKFENEREKDKRDDATYKIISMVKPIEGKMPVDGVYKDKEFYQENEWRYVPNKAKLILDEHFDSRKEALNKEMKEYKLEFNIGDIKYIFVSNDNDIPSLVDFIDKELGSHPHNDIKILTTRILSLDTISRDW